MSRKIDEDRLRAEIDKALESSLCCDTRLGVADIGVIDDVEISGEGSVLIKVLPCCPFGMTRMVSNMKAAVSRVAGVKDVHVEVVLDKIWTPERMSQRGKQLVMLNLNALAEKHGLRPRSNRD